MDEMNVQNAVNESTISQEPETQQEVNEVVTPETAPQDGEHTEDTSTQGNENSGVADENNAESATPFLEIQYNHEKKGLTRDEAAKLAQKGIYYEGAYNTIERVATLKGQSVEDFLKGIETAQDEAHRQSLISKFGEDTDTVDKMMELYNLQKEKTLQGAKESREQAAAQAEQSTNARIAEEFSKMKADFPELTEYSAMPTEVQKAAMDGMSLSHAYLLYKHNEQKKIDAAKQSQAEAAKKTAGSMETTSAEEMTEAERGYLNGLWGR